MMCFRWSSFVECVKRTSRWPCTNSAYVCTAMCVRVRVCVCVWYSMHEVVILPACVILLSKYTAIMALMTLRALKFVYLMYGTVIWLALNHQRVRFYCCVCALIWRCYWHSTQYGHVSSPSSCMCCPNTLQWRWWFCVDLRFSNGWRIGPEQTDRAFVLIAACVCAWTWTRQWFSMQYELLISPCSWPWCPNTLQWRWRLCVDICLLNVWNVCRIGGWPWLSSAYVCIAVCAFGMFG